MNLIEQLGGYTKAKECLNTPTARECVKNELRAELLQYRRQHNIFEVGDPVIRKYNNRLYWIISNIDNGSEFLIHQDKNARFKDCKVCELPCNLTHATDEEITIGKRL